jgi:hypothetical protein
MQRRRNGRIRVRFTPAPPGGAGGAGGADSAADAIEHERRFAGRVERPGSEGGSRDGLPRGDVAPGDLEEHLVGDGRWRPVAAESPFEQPLTQVLLVHFALPLAGLEEALVRVCVPVSAGVGGVHLVHEGERAAPQAEFVLRVDEDEPVRRREISAAPEELERCPLDLLPQAAGHELAREQLSAGYGPIVEPAGLLCGRGEQGPAETLVRPHARRQADARDRAARLVVAERGAGEVPPDHNLHGHDLAPGRAHGARRDPLEQVVGNDVRGPVEPEQRKGVQDLALARHRGEDPVEGRDAVRGGDQQLVADRHHVAHLAGGEADPGGQRGQVERAQGERGKPRQVPALHVYSSLRDFSVRESRP